MNNIELLDFESDFDAKVLSSHLPAAVLLYADWCDHCKRCRKMLETLSDEFADSIRFFIANVDYVPELEDRFRVGSIPAVLLFREGWEIKRWINEQQIDVYRDAFRELSPQHA